MWPRFEEFLAKFQELETQLGDPNVIGDRAGFTRVAKEHGALARKVKPYLEYKQLSQEIEANEAHLQAETDAEMRKYFEEELASQREKKAALRSRLEDMLLVEPGEDFGSVIVEIRAGTGGDEAALFAGDLYGMYTHYARDRSWKVEEISFGPGEKGGYKEVVFSVTGDDAYAELRYESGGHRVQRVPETEQQGRIHTSLATVAVLPEPDEAQIDV